MTLSEMLERRDCTAQYEEVHAVKKMVTKEKASDSIGVFLAGKRLRHRKFGIGVVLGVNSDKVEIRFEGGHGAKELMAETLIKNNLIEFL